MTTDVKIRYINRSVNLDLPTIFIFTKNVIPTFSALRDGVAWRTFPKVGKGSSCEFTYPIETEVRAAWNGGCCKSQKIDSQIGSRYGVVKNASGFQLVNEGDSSQTDAIEIANHIKVEQGIRAQLYKAERLVAEKKIVAFGQKATFIIHPKLYWGIASEIQDGQAISSAVLNSDHFFEMDIEGVTSCDVVLYGNAKDGYTFKVENAF